MAAAEIVVTPLRKKIMRKIKTEYLEYFLIFY